MRLTIHTINFILLSFFFFHLSFFFVTSHTCTGFIRKAGTLVCDRVDTVYG